MKSNFNFFLFYLLRLWGFGVAMDLGGSGELLFIYATVFMAFSVGIFNCSVSSVGIFHSNMSIFHNIIFCNSFLCFSFSLTFLFFSLFLFLGFGALGLRWFWEGLRWIWWHIEVVTLGLVELFIIQGSRNQIIIL